MKRARNPEKPSKKEKIRSEEKSKRSKKRRAEEKNKQPNKVPVVHDLSMEEKIMAKLVEIDKKIAEEKSKRSDQEKRMEEMLMRIEKIASKIEEQVAGDGMKKKKRIKEKTRAKKLVVREMADNEAGGLKKKKVVTWTLSQELLEYLRTKEVMGLLASEASVPLWANKMTQELFPEDLKEQIVAEFQENREFDAHVLYQYRTEGYVEIQEEVSDEEVDEQVFADKEHDVEFLTMEEEINAQLAEEEKKNKRLLTAELSHDEMLHYLFDEVLDYMLAKHMVTVGECNFRQALGTYDPYNGAKIYAFHRRSIERQANLLQQYRTKGSAVLQCYVTDDEAE